MAMHVISIDSPINRTSTQTYWRLQTKTSDLKLTLSAKFILCSILSALQNSVWPIACLRCGTHWFQHGQKTRVCCPRSCKKLVNCSTDAQLFYNKLLSLGPALVFLNFFAPSESRILLQRNSDPNRSVLFEFFLPNSCGLRSPYT